MSRKHVVLALVAAAILAVVVIFLSRPTGDEPVNSASGENLIDPAQAAMSNESGFNSPVDRSARWGFILYDDVKLIAESSAEPSAAGSRASTEVSLRTGDQVYIGETDATHKDQTKVTLFDGESGWVESLKIFDATKFAPWNILDTSTAPLKDWIPEELVPPASIAQYRVVVSSDFLMRAAKNPNSTIAEWAQAVLAVQAENAAQ